MKTNIQFVVHIDVSLTEACVDMSKFTAPMAWKKTSPEQHKFRSQEKLRSKKPAVPVQELGELLVDEFSSGASSATRAPWLLFFAFFVHVTYVGVNRKDFKFQSDIYNIYMHIQIRDSFCQHAWVLVLLYPCEVQKTASSAVDWLAKQGGQAKPADFVCRLSKLATAGRNPQNAERDLHRLLHKVSLRFEAEPEHVMVRMVNPSTLEVEPQLLPIFFLIRCWWPCGNAEKIHFVHACSAPWAKGMWTIFGHMPAGRAGGPKVCNPTTGLFRERSPA